jgi:serine/threonine protein kinase
VSAGTGDEKPTFRVGPDSDPDRYMLGVAVGGGAEGILYRGSITTATGLQLEVAIKMLQPQFVRHVEEWHIRWMEQVELLRSLQVPGVVPVRDGFLGPLPHALGQPGAGRTLYLVMNWVEGESLDEWVRHRTDRDPLDDLKVLLPVAAALDLMHTGRATGGVPIIHRDVKPSNVIVTGDGSVLVDFGLTRGLPTGQRLTGVAGTPGYLAPESHDGGVYSPSSDRYAFGGVAHFVVSGYEPPTDHRLDVFRTHLEAVPALKDRPEVVDHLMEMVAADPDARPTGLANWIGQLRRSSLEAGPDILNPSAPRRHPTGPREWSVRSAGRRIIGRPIAIHRDDDALNPSASKSHGRIRRRWGTTVGTIALVVLVVCGTLLARSLIGENTPSSVLILVPGRELVAGGLSLRSPNGAYTAKMQSDGAFVIFETSSGRVTSRTPTSGHKDAYAVLVDGVFYIYPPGVSGPPKRALWNSSTRGGPGASLELQNIGHLVIQPRDGHSQVVRP